MKILFKTFLPVYAMLSMAVCAGCSDDDEAQPVVPPSIEIGEITGEIASDGNREDVTVTLTPSENAETWYWKYEKSGSQADGGFTKVTGNTSQELKFSVDLDTDYILTAYAAHAQAESEPVTKTFRFNLASEMKEQVAFSVKNVSPFSMDVEVVKSVNCSKYVVAALLKETYCTGANEAFQEEAFKAAFKANALTSLDESAYYKPYQVATANGVFTEQVLGLVTVNADTEYLVAVYAIPEGEEVENGTIYYETVQTPQPALAGNVEVDIQVTKQETKSVTATIEADAACSRIIVGNVRDLQSVAIDFATASYEDAANYLIHQFVDMPILYTAPFEYTVPYLLPGEECLVYAIAIDANGQVGKVKYVLTQADVFRLDGEARITAATIGTQTDHQVLPVSIQVDSKTKSVRILCMSYTEVYKFKDELDAVMADEENSNFWTEYPANQLPATLPVIHPGDDYCIYAVAVDEAGKCSPVVNLINMSTKEDATFNARYRTMEEAVEVGSFTGNGEVTFSITQDIADGALNGFEYTIEQGANTAKAYVLMLSSSSLEKNIKTEVAEIFKEYATEHEPDNWKTFTHEFQNGTSETQKYQCPYPYDLYDDNYGGYILVVVTVDAKDCLKMTHYCLLGKQGVKTFVD